MNTPLRTGVLFAWVLATLLAAVGCGSQVSDGADTYLIFDRDSKSGEYRLFERKIETLDNLESGKGQLANLRAGGTIQVSNAQPQTRQEWRNMMQISGAGAPKLDYSIRDDGTIVPWDFHTTMMLTLYHHVERANRYFQGLGVARERMGKIPIYYYARQQRILPVPTMTDNAAYAFTIDAMLIPPRLLLKDVPFAANRGIIVHEYSHLVFNRLVYHNKRAPDYLVEGWNNPAVNRLSSLDEGVADIFAALQTDDPNFVSTSISEDLYDIDRDLSEKRTYTEDLATSVATQARNAYNPYQLGSVIASTVWALRSKAGIGDEQLGTAVVDTLRDLSDPGPDIDVADFFNALDDHLPSEARSSACSLFHDRLTAIEGELTCNK